MDAQLKKGFLEAMVLAALRDEQSYGYKIISEIAPHMEISESTLYPILKRLEGGGCLVTNVVEHNGRVRKYYSITPLGKQKLQQFTKDMEKLFELYKFINGGENDD